MAECLDNPCLLACHILLSALHYLCSLGTISELNALQQQSSLHSALSEVTRTGLRPARSILTTVKINFRNVQGWWLLSITRLALGNSSVCTERIALPSTALLQIRTCSLCIRGYILAGKEWK